MNAFEIQARHRKVLAMVAVIDHEAVTHGIDPFCQSGRIVLAARDWSDAVWVGIVRRAGLKSASETTRAAVVAAFRARATAPISSRGAA